jgi:hypothetical protein
LGEWQPDYVAVRCRLNPGAPKLGDEVFVLSFDEPSTLAQRSAARMSSAISAP